MISGYLVYIEEISLIVTKCVEMHIVRTGANSKRQRFLREKLSAVN